MNPDNHHNANPIRNGLRTSSRWQTFDATTPFLPVAWLEYIEIISTDFVDPMISEGFGSIGGIEPSFLTLIERFFLRFPRAAQE
jgi:hypothetical protein